MGTCTDSNFIPVGRVLTLHWLKWVIITIYLLQMNVIYLFWQCIVITCMLSHLIRYDTIRYIICT